MELDLMAYVILVEIIILWCVCVFVFVNSNVTCYKISNECYVINLLFPDVFKCRKWNEIVIKIQIFKNNMFKIT